MDHQRPTILCIEDDLDTCDLIVFVLGLSGYEVVVAHSVEDALLKVRKEPYALYSIDTNLPDGSGVELCRRIREFDANTPIIFYSADAHTGQIQKAMGAGAQAYLTKPTDPAILTKTVDCLLSKWTARVTPPRIKRWRTNEITV